MSDTLQPERFYTPFQRHEVVCRIATSQNIDLWAAADKFKAMEFSNPEGLKKLVDVFPPDPSELEWDAEDSVEEDEV